MAFGLVIAGETQNQGVIVVIIFCSGIAQAKEINNNNKQ